MSYLKYFIQKAAIGTCIQRTDLPDVFLSGAAATIYHVVWVLSLSLIFGGTHLAVTTVLSVFMGRLALGSYTIGKRVDALQKPLRFHGVLELAIALFAIIFIILMKVYPSVYIFLVPGGEGATALPRLEVTG
jgi:spermidine synthase